MWAVTRCRPASESASEREHSADSLAVQPVLLANKLEATQCIVNRQGRFRFDSDE